MGVEVGVGGCVVLAEHKEWLGRAIQFYHLSHTFNSLVNPLHMTLQILFLLQLVWAHCTQNSHELIYHGAAYPLCPLF